VLPRLVSPDDNAFGAWINAADELGNGACVLARRCLKLPPIVTCTTELSIEELHKEVTEAIAAVRDTFDTSANHHLLRLEPDHGVIRWNDTANRPEWSLYAMLVPWDQATLDDRATQLSRAIGGTATSSNELQIALEHIPERNLLRAFRLFSFDEFTLRAETMLRIAPTVTDKVYRVPTGRFGQSNCGMSKDSPLVTTVVSYLLSSLMEARANNNFGLVWRVALCYEIRGSWLVFAPGRILDILYQKWVCLSELTKALIVRC